MAAVKMTAHCGAFSCFNRRTIANRARGLLFTSAEKLRDPPSFNCQQSCTLCGRRLEQKMFSFLGKHIEEKTQFGIDNQRSDLS